MFCSCHAVAYLADLVVAKHAETSLKYPAFTDRPDHTEFLQILQIVQMASRLGCTAHPDHTDSSKLR